MAYGKFDLPPATKDTFGVIRWHELVCPKHGAYRKVETGYIGSKNFFNDECPACRDERLNAQLAQEYQQTAWLKMCQSIGVPKRFEGYSLDSYKCKGDEQRRAVETCRRWASGEGLANLLVFGRPGTGKTHLLCAALRHAVSRRKTARFVIESDMFSMVKETYQGNKGAMTERQVLDYFGDVDFLAIDDMGRSRWSTDESSILMKIINRRYNERKSTAISTNLTPAAIQTAQGMTVSGLEEYLGEGVMRRLEPNQRIMATWTPYSEAEASR